MPFLLLIIGLIIAAYTFYRFFINANTHQIKAVFLVAVIFTLIIALFFMAITGRLPAAIGLATAIIPFAFAYFREHQKSINHNAKATNANTATISSRKEALEILGLNEEATEDDIKKSYKSLMAKIHPDQDGSQWLASKLNEARDFLLK